jgi:hypothetical protein
MYIVREIRATDKDKGANTRDSEHDTKRLALNHIAKLGRIDKIRKLPSEGKGRIYAVEVRS